MVTVRKSALPARVGLYYIGLAVYWEQFAGLRERLEKYGTFVRERLGASAKVSDFGIVDSEQKAREAGEFFNRENVDLLVCFAATYATSAAHIAVPQICKRPVLVLNLQPAERMDYARTGTGEWLAQCCACCVPEISNAFARCGIPFHVVSGLLGLPESPASSVSNEATATHPDAVSAWRQIEEWVRAAGVQRTLQQSRMGFLGHTYPGMLDMYSDFTMITAQTGLHVEVLEMCDLAQMEQKVRPCEVESKREEVLRIFEVSGDSPSDPLARRPSQEQLEAACRSSVALDNLVHEYDLDVLTYYYRGRDDNRYQQLQESLILGLSLLTAGGVPCAGEGDMKTGVAMKICDALGVGGSYSEIVATDFVDQTILMGHDGPFHISIADRKPILRGLGVFHGKAGKGVSVEAKVRRGPITNLGISQTLDRRLKMIVSQGTATEGEILHIGNTMTPVRFAKRPAPFMDEWFALGPTHHFAMSIGHNAEQFKKVATLLNWDFSAVAL
ncbi:MAG: arabinose isomerase [Terriglobales bacterium]